LKQISDKYFCSNHAEVVLPICSKFKRTCCLYDIIVFAEVNAYRRRNSLEGICLSSIFRTNYAECHDNTCNFSAWPKANRLLDRVDWSGSIYGAKVSKQRIWVVSNEINRAAYFPLSAQRDRTQKWITSFRTCRFGKYFASEPRGTVLLSLFWRIKISIEEPSGWVSDIL